MAEAILNRKDTVLPPQLPDVTAAAEHVLTRALERCAKTMGLDGLPAAAHQVQQGNVVARLHCCASIAKQVAESLGTADRNVKAVYSPDYDVLFEDFCTEKQDAGEPNVSLVVWTRRRTATLDALVTAWNRALKQTCRDKIGSHGQAAALDAQIIEDADVERLFGSGREVTATRLAAYWMWSTNQVADIVYDRRAA